MNRFGKLTSGNLKTGTLLVATATLNFQKLFEIKFDLNSDWFEEKSLFLKGFNYHKESEMLGKSAPTPM